MSRHLNVLCLAWHGKRRAHTTVGTEPSADATASAASVAAIVPAGAEEAMPITVSWATPIASGSSRASMAGAEAAPGGTGAGWYLNLVS